jgi:acetylornithine deacetylase
MEKRITHLLSEVVGINSINPTLAGGPGEAGIANFICQHLRRLGLDAALYSVAAARASVVAVARGKDSRGSLVLNGHIDTVGVEGMPDPFTLRREGDRLYGRGAYDMKGGVAVMLALAESFANHPPAADVWLTFSADEEDRSLGTEQLVRDWLPTVQPAPAAAVFLEPTEEAIGVSHKGFTWFEIEILGQAAHGSRPAEGIDAILPLREALCELDRIRSRLSERPPDPRLGHASLHGGRIEGGTALSVIPARALLQWERRTLPDEDPQDVDRELDRVAAAVQQLPGGHRVTGRKIFSRPPYQAPAEAEIIARLRHALPAAPLTGLSFWADSALMGLAGVPSVLFGPMGHGAHAVDEWVSLKSVITVYEVLRKVVTG